MPGHQTALGCPACGLNSSLKGFGLRPDGSYDPQARPPKLVLYQKTFGGRGKLSVEHQDVPLPIAYGLRDALKAALARVEADIEAAGG